MKRFLATGILLAAVSLRPDAVHAQHTRTRPGTAPRPTPTARPTAPAAVPPPPPAPEHAVARPRLPSHDNGIEFELHGVATVGGWAWPWGGYGTGGGLRIGAPILRNGLIDGTHDELRLSAGIEVYNWPGPSFFFWMTFPVTLQWNFFISSHMAIFSEVGVAFDIYPIQGANCYNHPRYYCDALGVWPVIGGGWRFYFGGHNQFPALTLRIEYPIGMSIGVSI